MAKQLNNIVMKNAQGMFGGQVVFKQRGGITILAAPPTVDPDRVVSEDELASRERFAECIRSAKAAVKNPALKAAYEAVAKPNQTAFNVAFTDVYHAPQVLAITIGEYFGAVGDKLGIEAVDNVKVNAVKVRITDAANALVEEGNAVEGEDGKTWIYTATQANAVLAGTKITATAVDLAGNEASLVVAL